MVKQFIQLKRLTRNSNKGFTLLELLIASVVSSIVLGLALTLIVDQRKLFVKDQGRTQANQNLRAAIDLVGTDIKQAGERLIGTPFAVVQVIDGGASSDRLVLQRRVISEVLPVCQTITAGTQNQIIVSTNPSSSAAVPGSTDCTFSNANGVPIGTDLWPDNLEQWRNTRCSRDAPDVVPPVCNRLIDITANDSCLAQGGNDRECLWAYIYDPNTKKGEFFHYTFESSSISGTTTRYRIHRAPSATPINNTWQFTYTYTAPNAVVPNPINPVIHVLEERSYKLVDNPSLPGDKILELIFNRQTTKPIKLVNQLKDFQVRAFLTPPPALPALPFVVNFNATSPIPPATYTNWQTIKAIEVELTEKVEPTDLTPNQILSSKFFPRNATSDN